MKHFCYSLVLRSVLSIQTVSSSSMSNSPVTLQLPSPSLFFSLCTQLIRLFPPFSHSLHLCQTLPHNDCISLNKLKSHPFSLKAVPNHLFFRPSVIVLYGCMAWLVSTYICISQEFRFKVTLSIYDYIKLFVMWQTACHNKLLPGCGRYDYICDIYGASAHNTLRTSLHFTSAPTW